MPDNSSKLMIEPSKLAILEQERQKALSQYDLLLMQMRLLKNIAYSSNTANYRKLKPLSLWDKCKAIFKRKLKSK